MTVTESNLREALSEHGQTFEIGALVAPRELAGIARRRTRRNRILTGAGALVLFAALAAGVNAFERTNEGSLTVVNERNLPSVVAERASIALEYDGLRLGLSPAGDVVAVGTDSGMCVIDTATGTERTCENTPETFGGWVRPRWSPDSSKLVIGGRANRDILVLDVASGVVTNVTDDGINDRGDLTEGVPRDQVPSFSPSGNRIVFVRDVTNIALYDLTEQRIVNMVAFPDGDLHSPVMIDERRAMVGTVDRIIEFDMETGIATEIVDYSTTFPGTTDRDEALQRRRLYPVELLNDGRLLLSDSNIRIAYSQGGGGGVYNSGYYVADLETGSLTPLFATTPETGGWFGPTSVLRAGDDQLVVTWLGWQEGGFATSLHFSLLDLAVTDLPVVPTELYELWSTEDDRLPYAPGVPAQVSEEGTVLVGGPDGTTLVLQLETE